MGLGKRAQQKAERPGEILEAALQTFVRDGYRATRMEDVAAKVGVTKGTIYFYFQTKENLFAEVIRRFTPSIEPRQVPVASGTSIADELRTYMRFLYVHVAVDPKSREVFNLLISEGRYFPELFDRHFAEFLKPALDHISELLHRGVASGEFRSVGAERFPQIVLGPLVALNIWTTLFAQRRPLVQEKFIDAHLDLLFEGLRSAAVGPTKVKSFGGAGN